MNPYLKYALGVAACVAVTACRIEVPVPTSGSVATNSGSMNCAAGSTCTLDVADIHFDETFVATPAAGFVFDSWKAGNRRLCGGQTGPCQYSTANLAGNDDAIALLSDPDEVLYVDPYFKSTGFKVLGIGHSFFRPFIDGLPSHAAQAGVPNHTQSRFIGGGSNGAPQAFWLDTTGQKDDIQDVLDGGDVELFIMTYHPSYPTTTGYINWIDYALAQNPNTRFALALPWATHPGNSSAANYLNGWLQSHATVWHDLIDTLRGLYPGVDIYCIPYGQSAGELRVLFENGDLDDDVDFLVSGSGDAIYSDSFGHADDILEDLGRLVWLNAIYGIDLNNYSHNPGYVADLKGIAQTIMDAHDPEYDAAYR